MSCPTCDKTLEPSGSSPAGHRYFHCPICGTLRTTLPDGSVRDSVPALVARCQDFARLMGFPNGQHGTETWKSIGIDEAIHPPGRRL